MDTLTVIITTFGGALSATLGVLVGGVVTRRVQERHWLRHEQLRAYEELFSQYARFMMALRQAHLARTPVDIGWGAWSVSLTSEQERHGRQQRQHHADHGKRQRQRTGHDQQPAHDAGSAWFRGGWTRRGHEADS